MDGGTVDCSRGPYARCELGACKISRHGSNHSTRLPAAFHKHHLACHQVADKKLCHMVTCLVCRRAYGTVGALLLHMEYHVIGRILGWDLVEFANNKRGCCAAGEASEEDLFLHFRRFHMPQVSLVVAGRILGLS